VLSIASIGRKSNFETHLAVPEQCFVKPLALRPLSLHAMGLVSLPRASSKIYRHLKPPETKQAAEGSEVGSAEVKSEAQEAPQPSPRVHTDPQVLAALNEIKARDTGGVLEAAGGSGGGVR